MTTTTTAPAVAQVRTTSAETTGRDNKAGWLFSTPFLVLYGLFLVGPVLVGLVISFFNTATVKNELGAFVAFENYTAVLGNLDFWKSMWHSTLFTLLTVPFLVVLPLVAAILASRIVRNRWFFRIAFFAPFVVPSASVALIFAFLYAPEIGLFAKVLGGIGLPVPDFLGSTNGAWLAVTILTVWWTFGFNFVLYTAALQDIPEDTYEAAAIDGASAWQQMRSITVPLLRPTIGLVLMLQILASLKVFDQIFILLAGGPNLTTRPVIQYIYDTGFTTYRGGYAAAATMVYFLILVAISAVWMIATRRRGADA
ncbi:carbohydrate ABC transporter permease [Kineosporia babensis]|uniref:Sugar ABC transporter permease n=1 Tax=Kineosporia babensis TaxID=499548 RepID=A0A9X1NPA0_9ACTN|nr:sugar ABC transporter permease [Kineosporia babensis]